jgi:hypothetical protein
MRKCMGLMVLLCIGGLVLAQDKGKDKAKDKDKKEIPAEIVKVDAKGMTMTLKVDGKEGVYKATKETQFIGPKGGISTTKIKDKRLQKGIKVKIVVDGMTLKEVHIPTITKKDKDKTKDKDKKDK